ncbi:MAG: ribonuclease P protein component [Alkalispirochaetaceae bacterium]
MRKSLTKAEILRKPDDIRRVFNAGRRVATHGAMVRFLRNDLGRNRILFATTRSFGNAVRRNRARRLTREAYRQLKPNLQEGYDLACVVYPDGDTLCERLSQLGELFRRAGLIKDSEGSGTHG